MFDLLADRIEAAVKYQFRDLTKTIPEEVGVRDAANSELLNSIKSYQINSSKAREALEEIRAYVADMVCRSERNESLRKAIYNSARYALSAPPRNCDVMDWRTAWVKWRTELHTQKPCGYAEALSGTEQFMDWYMSEAKGEEK
jgi:hypothetical protein